MRGFSDTKIRVVKEIKIYGVIQLMTNEQQTDVAIIQRVLKGEQHAFSLLMAKYEAPFLRFATQYTKDPDDAADVVQEAFIKIYRNLTAYDKKRPFSSWAYRIVRNEGLNWLRARKRLTFGETAELILNQVFSASSPELEYAQVELQDRMRNCFAAMPETYAQPLKMHFIEEKSYQEIGQVLKLPIGTVGTRINRAKAMIKRIWSNHNIIPGQDSPTNDPSATD